MAQTWLLLHAGEEIDVIVSSGCTGKHHAVRMECRGSNWRLPSLVEEARIWLNARELLAFKIEDFDCMIAGSTEES